VAVVVNAAQVVAVAVDAPVVVVVTPARKAAAVSDAETS
jgi:hypothetical protein